MDAIEMRPVANGSTAGWLSPKLLSTGGNGPKATLTAMAADEGQVSGYARPRTTCFLHVVTLTVALKPSDEKPAAAPTTTINYDHVAHWRSHGRSGAHRPLDKWFREFS